MHNPSVEFVCAFTIVVTESAVAAPRECPPATKLAKGLWVKSYAGSNVDEFFAELTMWYCGTHGDMSMTGPKPASGREGLKNYDPEAFVLIDDFYSGRIEITKVEPRRRRSASEPATTTSINQLKPVRTDS